MRIGYPCVNLSVGCSSSRTFRLKSYSEERMSDAIENNLNCLKKVLRFNLERGILFFRITSDLIPFASHPICTYNWQDTYRESFKRIGRFIKKHRMRVTMHPGQYTVLNSKDDIVYLNSIKDLEYHVQVLDLLGLGPSAKVQTHVGGVYGDKETSLNRFVERYKDLDVRIRKRYVIENDERSYSLSNCLDIHEKTGIPVILDILHHQANNRHESIHQAFSQANETWRRRDGIPIVHY
ncbi:MAG: UV DNA damage repair endonuclease UvsE, partial [Candidatus Hodarchaeota archaeon]